MYGIGWEGKLVLLLQYFGHVLYVRENRRKGGKEERRKGGKEGNERFASEGLEGDRRGEGDVVMYLAIKVSRRIE
jgi:hypothetical protein